MNKRCAGRRISATTGKTPSGGERTGLLRNGKAFILQARKITQLACIGTKIPETSEPGCLCNGMKTSHHEEKEDMITISKETIENLKAKVKGQIVLPSDSSYDEVRKIWNAM